MKKIIVFVLATCLSISLLKSETIIEVGTELNVTASSGLKMRNAPGLHSKVITVVPYGATVTVLADFLEEKTSETIEWVEGSWTLVAYGDDEGYVFDGFLSELPVPLEDFEKTIADGDLTYPLISWAEYHFEYMGAPDTVQANDHTILTHQMTGGAVMRQYEDTYLYKVELELTDVRIMDVYHLLKNMLAISPEVTTYEKETLFIKTKEVELDKITIDMDNPVEIRKIGEDKVRITVLTFNEGCNLYTVE